MAVRTSKDLLYNRRTHPSPTPGSTATLRASGPNLETVRVAEATFAAMGAALALVGTTGMAQVRKAATKQEGGTSSAKDPFLMKKLTIKSPTTQHNRKHAL